MKIIFLNIILILTCINNLKNTNRINIILIGTKHPIKPQDDYLFKLVGNKILLSNNEFSKIIHFSTGKGLIKSLDSLTNLCGELGKVIIIGHSGYQGLFVKAESGFYRDEFINEKINKKIKLSSDAALISDLKKEIVIGNIKFSNQSYILILGCNTANGNINFCKDLEAICQIPIIGFNKNIDFYNVPQKGIEILLLGNGNFNIYKNNSTKSIYIDTNKVKIKDLIHLINSQTSE